MSGGGISGSLSNQMAQQMLGGNYQGATASGGGGGGLLAAPIAVTPQQQANQGLPFLPNVGNASRSDIANFMMQMRQSMPNIGYNPAIPQTMMPSQSQLPASRQSVAAIGVPPMADRGLAAGEVGVPFGGSMFGGASNIAGLNEMLQMQSMRNMPRLETLQRIRGQIG